jgi:phosphodiesterase/alkaline phosphatase D-like protein
MGSKCGKGIAGEPELEVRPTQEQGGEVMVLCGPVVGEVQEHTAIVMLEVDVDIVLTCTAVPADGDDGGLVVGLQQAFRGREPGIFKLEGLQAGTMYHLRFGPVLQTRDCVVKTMPLAKDLKRLRLMAVGCDYPSKVEKSEENPWNRVQKVCEARQCDVLLHLGDQVYTWENGRMSAAMRELEPSLGTDATSDVAVTWARAREQLQESYRYTWNQQAKAAVLSHMSNLMIWSDNDITNDFTSKWRPDGSQEYEPLYLRVAMHAYQMYQRRLWDPDYNIDRHVVEQFTEVDESHFHRYGPCGVFMIDMRGNRISSRGVIKEEGTCLVSDRQWNAIENAFATSGLTCMIMTAEIPFVSDPFDVVRRRSKDLSLLKDHWAYFPAELTRLLDLCFSWKIAQAGREVILLGGDIHVSVFSTIADSQTGQTIRQITTSPITNRPSKFYSALEGTLSERYTYKHEPLLGQRTFCAIDLTFKDDGSVESTDVELVGVPAAMKS